jgi:thiol-disulfide isomerase/thioredoxin
VVTFTGVTTDGEELTSEIFADSKLTMINVWATYCNPCLAEMPDLGEIAASYDKEDFRILGVISDVPDTSGEESIQYAKELIEQTKADYPHMLLNESLYMSIVSAAEAVPTTFFVNQKGEALGYVVGAQSKETWEGIIDELLAEKQ